MGLTAVVDLRDVVATPYLSGLPTVILIKQP